MSGGAGTAGAYQREAYGLDWPHPLFAYQKAGIDKLVNDSSVLLADEMGLGKTIQAVALCSASGVVMPAARPLRTELHLKRRLRLSQDRAPPISHLARETRIPDAAPISALPLVGRKATGYCRLAAT
jgi:SNF2-related domain